MLDNQGYTHTPEICNTYCFFTATVTRMRLDVALYIHCLYCLKPFRLIDGRWHYELTSWHFCKKHNTKNKVVASYYMLVMLRKTKEVQAAFRPDAASNPLPGRDHNVKQSAIITLLVTPCISKFNIQQLYVLPTLYLCVV
jgi:hypothetical protein